MTDFLITHLCYTIVQIIIQLVLGFPILIFGYSCNFLESLKYQGLLFVTTQGIFLFAELLSLMPFLLQ
jgi:hypothetical protein